MADAVASPDTETLADATSSADGQAEQAADIPADQSASASDASLDTAAELPPAGAAADAAPDSGVDSAVELAADAAPDAKPDAVADVMVDAAVEPAADAAPDAKPDAVADVMVDTAVDAAADAAPDAKPDAVADVTVDAAVDAAADAAPDAKPDAVADVLVDAAVDAAADAAPDAKPDAVADVIVDAAVDAAADTAPDAKPDAPSDSVADALVDAAPDLPNPCAAKQCNDGNACTTDSCDPKTGLCIATATQAPCDDGNGCTQGDLCAAKVCQAGAPKSCDDGDACTADSCEAKTGTCSHKQTCAVLQPLPYKTEFPCGAKPFGWTWNDAAASGTNAAWAVDATPASPKPLSAGCTLNFNNGADFTCTAPILSSAMSPWIDTSKALAKPGLELTFALAGSWEPNQYDNFDVYATADGKAWTLLAMLDGPGATWKTLTYDLSAFAGSMVLVRFDFSTTDCYSNSGTGPFIDDFAVQAKAGCATSGCDDGKPCTKDTCAASTGTCSYAPAPVGTPCEDGNLCTTADSCAAGVCNPGAAKSCDDGNACTVDACAVSSGACTHVANQLCGAKGKTLPYASAFDCASPGLADWTATGTPNGPSWAFDADGSTFEFPGYQSPKCSANFNNGLDYQCPKTGATQVSGSLTSPALDGTAVQPGQLVYLDLWLAGEIDYADELILETTTDGASWQQVRSYAAWQLNAKKWKLFVDPLTGVAGKTFAWRLRFTSGDCVDNNKPGVFVDDIKVYAAAPCAQTDAWAKQDFDPYGGYNVGTFQMGSSPSLTLDPKVAVAPGVTKVVYWYVSDSSTDKMQVDLSYAANSAVDVCVQHQCYKSKAYSCTVSCPAGTTKTVAGDGCCSKGLASGQIGFAPIGSGITSGFTKVFLTNKGSTCVDVQVKSYF